MFLREAIYIFFSSPPDHLGLLVHPLRVRGGGVGGGVDRRGLVPSGAVPPAGRAPPELLLLLLLLLLAKLVHGHHGGGRLRRFKKHKTPLSPKISNL